MDRLYLHVALLVAGLVFVRPVNSTAESGASRGLASGTVQLLDTASSAIAAGNYPAAYQTLLTAFPQAPAQTTYHLGRLAAAEQQPVAARDLLRRFLADQSLDAADPLRAEAQKLLDSLPSREAGEVSVGAPRGAQVQLDGRLVGALPLTLPLLVQSGVHRLQVSQGRWRAETEFQVRTARTVEVRFKSGSDLAVVTRPASVLSCEQYAGDGAGAEPISHALESAVKHENYAFLSWQAALAYAPDLAACEPPPKDQLSAAEAQAACCLALAQRFGIERIVDLRLSLAGSKWQGELGLREPEVDGAVSVVPLACGDCSPKEAGQRLAETLTKLFAQADKQGRSSLQIDSRPPGAEVFLAGRRVGTTPYARKVWAGSYPLELRRSGYANATQPVEVIAEQPATVSVELVPQTVVAAPLPPTLPPRRPTWRIGVGAAGLAAGALLIGFGISALSVNGACSLDGLPACNGIYRTTGVGGGLVAVGSALAIGGAVLIALPPRK